MLRTIHSLFFAVNNKDAVAESILSHCMRSRRCSTKYGKVFFKAGALKLLTAFPGLFAELFVFSGNISVNDVVRCLCHDETDDIREGDHQLFGMVQNYVRELSESRKFSFLP